VYDSSDGELTLFRIPGDTNVVFLSAWEGYMYNKYALSVKYVDFGLEVTLLVGSFLGLEHLREEVEAAATHWEASKPTETTRSSRGSTMMTMRSVVAMKAVTAMVSEATASTTSSTTATRFATAAALTRWLLGGVLWWVRDGFVAHFLVTSGGGRGRSFTFGFGSLGAMTTTMGKGASMAVAASTMSTPWAWWAAFAAVAISTGEEWVLGDIFSLLLKAGNKVPEGSGLVDITN
jgi:hypothetical protein